MKPSSLQEAVLIIQATFPAQELQAWTNLSEDEALAKVHFGLGMWIRNQWVYGGSPLVTEIHSLAWSIHDDDISSIVLRALWQYLKHKTCPDLQELLSSYSLYPEAKYLNWE
ncbi:DUF6794 domain-containing protein [Pseudoduganella danionis]|uniref:DUF6794 domain-containing protein n=1 Tax=Pseudoduganella danionis TaxID=1890295 RepID=UPI0035B424BE